MKTQANPGSDNDPGRTTTHPGWAGTLRGLVALATALVGHPFQLQATGSAAAAETNRASSAPPRARLVVMETPGTTARYIPQLAPVTRMVEQGLLRLTGRGTVSEAWHSLISTQDTVGVKVFSRPGATSGTRPTVVEAVVKSLLAAGIPPRQVVLWDQHLTDLRLAGFFQLAEQLGVRIAGSADAGYDPDVTYETPLLGQLVYGDIEFGKSGPGIGRKSHLSRLLTSDITKIVSIAPLLNNNLAGVSGHCWGVAMGSIDNALRFENYGARLAEAVPEILALEQLPLRDRMVLSITDALLCQYQGEERQLLHYSTILDQLWFSLDPVALDTLAVAEIEKQRRLNDIVSAPVVMDLYENLALLELGVCRTNRIDIIR